MNPKSEVESRDAKGAQPSAPLYAQVVKVLLRIPKGFRNQAQGCEERATLGKSSGRNFNPNGVASVDRSQAATPSGLTDHSKPLPRVARASQPWAGGRNPFGIHGLVRIVLSSLFKRSGRFNATTSAIHERSKPCDRRSSVNGALLQPILGFLLLFHRMEEKAGKRKAVHFGFPCPWTGRMAFKPSALSAAGKPPFRVQDLCVWLGSDGCIP